MLKKKQKIQGVIEEVLPNGLGYFKYQKDIVFVKYVLEHEVVEVGIDKKLKEGYLGVLLRVVKPSSIRAKVHCSYFQRCGSCSNLHMLYPFELKKKTNETKAVMAKYALKMKVHNCEGSEVPYGYRNKLILTFSRNKKQEIIAGFYESLSHRVIGVDKCLLHDDATNQLIMDVKQVVKQCRIDGYDENSKTGFLRHVLIRENSEHRFMVVLVCSSSEFRGKKHFVQALVEKNRNIETIIQNINTRSTSVVLGKEEYVLYGKGVLEDTLCGLKFTLSPKSFYQIHHNQCEKLYSKVLSLLDLKGDEKVIDTYSGIGTISLLIAQHAREVVGVELNGDAIRDANYNKEQNHITNVSFVEEDAGVYMQHIAKQRQHVEVVIMDPTRDGSDEAFLSALLALKPSKIVYISCNPMTQARDLKYLLREYHCKELYLYDMFPRTSHVESVGLLERKINKGGK